VPRRGWWLRVSDIVEAVERVESFTHGLTLETFVADQRTIAAVSYELVVIGEAARHVPADVQASAPDVPWMEMRDMRNIAAHEYFGVDVAIVWQTATRDVPLLAPPLRALLAR